MQIETNQDALSKSAEALLGQDLFQFGVPLMKSFQVDENGDVIVEGIASVPKQDHQGEDLDPRGFVLNYFEKSGWIKWEHKGVNNGPAAPDQFIGEPIEARVTPDGEFYLKARIYRDSKYAPQIKQQLELLEKSQSTRRMGFSIEGQALQRDPKNPLKVLKAIIRNVVLTMNPVNDGTWVVLCKSLTSPDALEVGLDSEFSIEKAMDTGGAAAITPQSLEGVKPNDGEEDDETAKALSTLRSYVKKLLDKSLAKSLIEADVYGVAQGAYDHAVDSGLDHKQAVEFAELVHQKQSLFKSVPQIAEQGGASMSRLAKLLGESVDELEKSLSPEVVEDEDAELDNLIKSLEGGEEAADEDEGGEEAADEDDDMEKSLDTDLEKSMSDEALESLDVSAFLQDLVKSINGALGSFSADQEAIGQGIAVMAKAMKAQGELIKGLQSQVEELGARPAGRRSAVTPNDVQTAQRTGGQPSAPMSDELNKSQVIELLNGAVNNGKIPFSKVTAFEMGFGVDTQTAQTVGLDLSKNPSFRARG